MFHSCRGEQLERSLVAKENDIVSLSKESSIFALCPFVKHVFFIPLAGRILCVKRKDITSIDCTLYDSLMHMKRYLGLFFLFICSTKSLSMRAFR